MRWHRVSTHSRLKQVLLMLRRVQPLGLAAFLLIAFTQTNQAAQRRPSEPIQATYAPETTLYGPTTFTKYGSPSVWVAASDEFTADTIVGKRYRIEVTVGTGITGLQVFIDDEQWIAPNDSRVREFDLATTGTHTIEVMLKGSSGSSVDVSITRGKDPTFLAYGPQTFVRTLTPPQVDSVSFMKPNVGESQYVMRAINGFLTGSNRTTNANVKLNGSTIMTSPGDFKTTIATVTKDVSVIDTNWVKVTNSGTVNSRLTLQVRAKDGTPPQLSLAEPDSVDTAFVKDDRVPFTGSVADETPGWLTITETTPWLTSWSRPWIETPGAFSDTVTLGSQGRHRFRVQAVNSASLSTRYEPWLVLDTEPPTLTISVPGTTVDSSSTLTILGSWRDSTFTTVMIDGDTVGTGYGGSISYGYPLDIGMNRIRFRAVDQLGNETAFTRFHLRLTGTERGGPTLTPSALIATSIPRFYDSIRFLWGASPALQEDMDTTRFVPNQIAVVRGHVIGRDYGPMANVKVTVLGHDEFGSTLTRNDGTFDLAVNGGRQYTLRFTCPSYLEAQRKVTVPINDFAIAEAVALIGVTARYTDVNLDAPVVAHSRFASDANGDRDMRFIFRPGTRARVVKAPGDTLTFPKIRLRATEYTVGGDGLASMPGELPPTTAYTYCIDIRTDQADSVAALVGAAELMTALTDTVACYLGNFLHLPVGTWMPLGFYDPDSGVWVGASDGVILKIIGSEPGGLIVDSNGDTLPDSQARLDSLGITSNELSQLAGEYAVGDTVWRVRMTHFSKPDANCNIGLLGLLSQYGSRAWQFILRLVNPCLAEGASTVECESHVLRDRIAVAGTPFSLNYRSDRAPGDLATKTLRFKLFQGSPPPDLARVVVRLDVAGRRIETVENNPTALSEATVTWDGKDAYGRPVVGSVYGRLGVGYQYKLYMSGGTGSRSYGNPAASVGGGPVRVGGERDLGLIDWSYQRVVLGAADASSSGLGGWTLSPHHFFDPKGTGTVYYGDGSVLPGDRLPRLMWVAVGDGSITCSSPCADTIPVAGAITHVNRGMVRAPDGSLIIADWHRGSIYRLGKDHHLHRIAGTSVRGDFGPEGPATSCRIPFITDMAIAPDGTIYVACEDEANKTLNRLIFKITADGAIRKVIGIGDPGTYVGVGAGDGGPVTAARISIVTAIACGPDGSVFFSEYCCSSGDAQIRRITPDGYIHRYAGGGDTTLTLTPIRATNASLVAPSGMIVDGVGKLYSVVPGGGGNSNFISRISPDGAMALMLVSGTGGPNSIALAPEGGFYLAQTGTPAAPNAGGVFFLDTDGSLSQIAGFDDQPVGHGKRAMSGSLEGASRMLVNDDGSFYVATKGRVLLISRGISNGIDPQYNIPSADGSVIDEFDTTGRHLRTRDALTGAIRYSFRYDAAGRLVTVRDFNGDSTIIVRNNTTGAPESIIGPFGQTTTLGMDGPYLGSASFNGREITLHTYQPNEVGDGLLYELVDDDRHHVYHYDDFGRLDEDTDPESFTLTLEPTTFDIANQTWETAKNSLGGRRTEYDVTTTIEGNQERRVRGPDGFESVFTDNVDGQRSINSPDGSAQRQEITGDPRLGMLAQYPSTTRDSLPSGDVRMVTMSRTVDGGFNPPSGTGTWTESVRVNGKPPLVRRFAKSGGAVDTLQVTSPEGRIARTEVDTLGRPITVLLPGVAPVEYTRDGHGRVTHVEQGARYWDYDYDNSGRLESVTDALSRVTEFHYDGSDRDTLQTLPGGRSIGLRYDATGNLTSIRPPGRMPHEFGYTKTDLNRRYMPPALTGVDSTATRYEFNGDRQLTRAIRADGSVISLAYDATKARLDSVTVARGKHVLTYSGSTGQLSTLVSPDTVTLTYAYDGPLVTSEQWSGAIPGGQARAVSREYDLDFRPLGETVTGTSAVAYEYDDDGLLTAAGDLVIHRRAEDGAMDSTHVSGGGGSIESSLDYDPDHGELRNPRYVHNSQGVLFQQSLERDVLGRITHVTELAFGTSREWRYRYDVAGRLYGALLGVGGATPETLATYSYDANGNRTRVVHFSSNTPTTIDSAYYDAQDRLTSSGTTQFEYTAAGELVRRIETGGDTTSYAYDALGNLTSVRLDNGDSVKYVVDGANRRVGRKLGDVWTNGWIYQNALRPAAELDASGAVLNRYVYGADGLSPSLMIRGGATYRVITDHLGSVRGIVNVSTGAVAQSQTCDPWGVLIASTGTGFQSLGYAGGLADAATGLVRFGARDYDVHAGRWTAKDPIGFQGNTGNLYFYVEGNPVNLADPHGLSGTVDAIAGFGDGVSLGLTDRLRCSDADAVIDKSSGAYRAARSLGTGWFGATLTVAAFVPAAGGSVFWTGTGALEKATEFAATNGASILTTTIGGRILQSTLGDSRSALSQAIWDAGSALYALNTSKIAGIVYGASVRVDGTYNKIEAPILRFMGLLK